MKMDIVESDLKQLFMWIKNQDADMKKLEKRIADIEQLIEDSVPYLAISLGLKDGKDNT